ncbi:MAG: hypothetical protein K1X89_07680 [Myxococcaceae bacterium]|nr:hypothetical protein [Myxococcaceae bacterium]
MRTLTVVRAVTFLLLAAPACATLNTAGMSEHCKALYNACLNACPGAQREGRQESNVTRLPNGAEMDTAQCVNRCNEQGRACKEPAPAVP